MERNAKYKKEPTRGRGRKRLSSVYFPLNLSGGNGPEPGGVQSLKLPGRKHVMGHPV